MNFFEARVDSICSYVVLLSAMVNHFILFGTGMSFSLFFNVLMKYFDASRSSTAWFNSIQSGIFYFSGPVVGILLKRYNWRIIIISGALLNGIGLSMSYFANSIYFLYISIGLLVGFGYGCMHVPAIVAVGSYFTDPNRRSFAQALSLAGGSLGTLIMPPLVYKAIVKYGFRGAFLFLGGLMFQTIVFGCLFLPLPPQTKRPNKKENRDGSHALSEESMDGKLLSSQSTDKPEGVKGVKSADPTNYSSPDTSSKVFVTYKVDRDSGLYDTPPTQKNSDISYADDTLPNNDNAQFHSHPSEPLLSLNRETSSQPRRSMSIDSLVMPDLEYKPGLSERGDITKKGIWRSTKFILFVLMSACWTASLFIIMQLLFDFLINDRKVRPAMNAAWIFSIIMISAMVGNLVAAGIDFVFYKVDKLLERTSFGKRRKSSAYPLEMQFPSEKEKVLEGQNLFKCWLFNVCTIGHGVVASLLYISTRKYENLCAISVCFGLSYGIKLALGPTICGDLFGIEHLPFVYGYTMMASGVGILISPPLGGFLVDMTKSYDATFLLSAALSLVSFVLYSFLLVREGRKKRRYLVEKRALKRAIKAESVQTTTPLGKAKFRPLVQSLPHQPNSFSKQPLANYGRITDDDKPYQETTVIA